MECTTQELDLKQTGFFSEIVTDYVEGNPALRTYFTHTPDFDGLKASLEARIKHHTNRTLLVDTLTEQYKFVPPSAAIQQQLDLLRQENTFTITTAHQPNIFTGYLYFVYKILHTVKLAETARQKFPDNHFVPVYYMGSEDADLDELGKIFLNGDSLVWNTSQTGAVGRMSPQGLDALIEQISGRISIFPYGKELVATLKKCYLESDSIQTATFKLVHFLFEKYGVVVLIPDHPSFKKQLIPIFTEDLLVQKPSAIVEETIGLLEKDGYKVQAQPREINLFYLNNQIRGRIVKEETEWRVLNTNIRWNEQELLEELNLHPEKFSPNVILRGLLQETILPNIAFIGGGGELAYWLEYKSLFEAYAVPFPVLLLRNSFLYINEQVAAKMNKTGVRLEDLFRPSHEVLAAKALEEAQHELKIDAEISAIEESYGAVKNKAVLVDATLEKHVDALKTKAVEKLLVLQKKIIRAEKKKHQHFAAQYEAIKQQLFPRNGLQERVENILPYYAEYGADFLEMVYRHSPALAKSLVVLKHG